MPNLKDFDETNRVVKKMKFEACDMETPKKLCDIEEEILLRDEEEEKRHIIFNCPKLFFQCVDLKKHKRINTGNKPFHCDQCLISFSLSVDLKKTPVANRQLLYQVRVDRQFLLIWIY